jgi:hypothetical protein
MVHPQLSDQGFPIEVHCRQGFLFQFCDVAEVAIIHKMI